MRMDLNLETKKFTGNFKPEFKFPIQATTREV